MLWVQTSVDINIFQINGNNVLTESLEDVEEGALWRENLVIGELHIYAMHINTQNA